MAKSIDATEYAGKIAVVTGAGSGIGRSSAVALAARGAKVHVVDLNGAAAIAVTGEITEAGGSAVAHTVDCTDPDSLEALAVAVFEEDGAVDVLHNNAGIAHGGKIQDTVVSDWQKVININVLGMAYGVQAFVPKMLKQGRESHVVNTASGAGLAPNPKMAPYVTSKFAAVGMSLSLDAELSEQGIRVMALCPGLVNTNIISDTLLSGEMAARREQTKKMYEKRGASPESVADAMLEGLRKNKVIVITPWQHVKPSWWILRISPRLFQVFSRKVLAKAFD